MVAQFRNFPKKGAVMSTKVVVLGGGVGGMSAAHELIRRGFEVEVYEQLSIPGGKARSMNVPNSATPGHAELPGEHGFRFFPRFYQHITATMKQIPYKGGTVFDNLVDTTRIDLLQYHKLPMTLISRFPRSLKDLIVMLKLVFTQDSGLTDDEVEFFAKRIWQVLSSCDDRRWDELERTSWAEFLEAGHFSPEYTKFLVEGLTRSLVAAKGNKAASKTVGDILVQLIFDIATPGTSSDRLLNGPTNDVWIDPWLEYLTKKGVKYHLEHSLTKISMNTTEIKSVTVEHKGASKEITADYFICAVPVDRLAPLINSTMSAIDPTLDSLKPLSKHVSWMNGIQYYLNTDVKITHGHAIYVDTPWAITTVSQAQFWPDFPMSEFGDGNVKGIISVDISEWDVPGTFNGKKANECSADEIATECWKQMQASLIKDIHDELKDEYLISYHLDPSIVIKAGEKTVNSEPLLVNVINSWHLRPDDFTRIPNMFIASDFVRTNTDLATMEGANEAARRAVNSIIADSKSKARFCKIYKLHMPWFFKLYRWFDQRRYNKGLPWSGKIFN